MYHSPRQNGGTDHSNCAHTDVGPQLKPDKSTSKDLARKKENGTIECHNRGTTTNDKAEIFEPLHNQVDRIASEIEVVSKMLSKRGLETYFDSLVGEFHSLAFEFRGRIDGMMSFVSFLNQHHVPLAAANAGYFAVLPEEVILQIFSYFDERELGLMATVCIEWKRLSEDNTLWRRLCVRRWHRRKPNGKMQILDEEKLRSWKNYFLNSARVDRNWKSSEYKVHTLEHGSAVLCVAFNEDKIVTGSADETIKVWDYKTKRCLHTLSGHVYTVKSLQFDDDKIVSGGGTRDRCIKIWDMHSGVCTDTLEGHSGGVFTLQYDDEKIVSGATDHTIRVWSMKTKQCLTALTGHQHDVYCLQYDKYGRLVSGAGSGDKTVRVWDLYTEQLVQEIKGHRGGVFCLHFERNIVVSGSKGEIKVWDLNTGDCVHTLDKHNSFVLGIQFDDTKMVSGGYDEDFAVKLWDWRTMSLSYNLKGHTGNIRTVRFDERAIVSGAADKTAKVWEFGF